MLSSAIIARCCVVRRVVARRCGDKVLEVRGTPWRVVVLLVDLGLMRAFAHAWKSIPSGRTWSILLSQCGERLRSELSISARIVSSERVDAVSNRDMVS